MNEKHFWMVWCPAKYAPTFRHETELAARAEAARLARLNPGNEFFVLESTSSARCTEPQVIYAEWPSGEKVEEPTPKQHYDAISDWRDSVDGKELIASTRMGRSISQAMHSAVELAFDTGKTVNLRHNDNVYEIKAYQPVPF